MAYSPIWLKFSITPNQLFSSSVKPASTAGRRLIALLLLRVPHLFCPLIIKSTGEQWTCSNIVASLGPWPYSMADWEILWQPKGTWRWRGFSWPEALAPQPLLRPRMIASSCHKLHGFLSFLRPEQNLQDLVLCIFPQWNQQTRLISPASKMFL